MTWQTGVIVGSLRKDSMSARIAQALRVLAPPQMALRDIAIADLPLYNGDLEADTPATWQRIRDEVASSDALIVITPEYNRSIPGGLKNAIDVVSKPNGRNGWVAKPVLVIGQSSGPLGGLAGAIALKQTLLGAGAAVLPHPEVYLARVATLFDGHATLQPDTQNFLRGVLVNLESWITRLASK